MAEADIEHIKGMVSAERFVLESFLSILEDTPEKFSNLTSLGFQRFKITAAAYNHFLMEMTPNLDDFDE